MTETVEKGSRSEKSKLNPHSIHENNHERPNKRTRIGPSPVSGSSKLSAINLDDAQNSFHLNPSSQPSSIVANHQFEAEPTGGLVRRREGVRIDVPPRHNEFRDVSMREPSTSPSPDIKHTTWTRKEDSPDDLLDQEFMKSARQQRVKRSDEDIKHQRNDADMQKKNRLDRMLSSSSPPRTPKKVYTTPNRSSTLSAKQSKPASRMQQRLEVGDESPDALQGECTTQPSTIPIKQKQEVKDSRRLSGSRSVNNKEKFGEGKRKRTVSTGDRSIENVTAFTVIDYIYSNIPVGSDMVLLVNTTRGTLSLQFLNPKLGNDPVLEIQIRSIFKILYAPDDDRNRMMLKTNSSNVYHRKLCFELSPGSTVMAFRDELDTMDSSIELCEKRASWITGVFQNVAAEWAGYKKRSAELVQQAALNQTPTLINKSDHRYPPNQTGVKKARLIDRLDSSVTLISGANRAGSYRNSDSHNTSRLANSLTHETAEDTVLSNNAQRRPTRTTRSNAGKSEFSYDDAESPEPVARVSAFTKLKRWKKPLVYPPAGKKRETVQFDDLQRLDDDEFLNDNLVCLFIRYLEEHADEQEMRKIHFFNSFLFEALTKDVKSRREINFDAVKRWTTKVDLFSRDFVVVPVNESLHWFVMIICNLSYFGRKHAPKAEEDVDDSEITHSIQPATRALPEVILRSDLEAEEASARNSFAEMNLDDQQPPVSNDPADKASQRSRTYKKQRKSLPKYDVDKPIIITLDSLGQPRSMTASLLRQYIVAEALDKQGWSIDGNEIKGMTAKGIPHQDNFSDCGLYLCMYLEQFILEPYKFVRRILQRTDGARWPQRIESSDLRDRLRSMLLTLHRRQISHEPHDSDIPELGSILVEMRDPRSPNGEPSTTINDTHATTKGWDNLEDEHHDILHERLESDNPKIRSLDQWQQAVNDPVEIVDDDDDDDDLETQPRHTGATSHYFPLTTSPNDVDKDHTSHLPRPHDRPRALAEQLQHQRSPKKDYVDLMDNVPEVAAVGSSSKFDLMNSNHQRKAHLRFKKAPDPRHSSVVSIDDDEFRGFSDNDIAPTIASEPIVDHDLDLEPVHKQSVRKRKILEDITKNGRYRAPIEAEQQSDPEMLL